VFIHDAIIQKHELASTGFIVWGGRCEWAEY